MGGEGLLSRRGQNRRDPGLRDQASRASQSVMIRPMRGPAWPSHSGGSSPVYGPSSHAFSTAEASSADEMSLLLPWVMVMGRSVFGRTVRQIGRAHG